MPAKITFNDDEITYIIDAYVDAGWTLADLAEEFGVSGNTIRTVLIENDIEIRPRGRRPNNA
jgi:lambda repressor-like predicted transcriptional regulator